MRLFAAAVLAALVLAQDAAAAERPRCGVPDYLLFGDSQLKRVSSAVVKQKRLRISVVGTGSSALAGPDGPPSAYPARLEAVLTQRLPGVKVSVVTLLRTRLTAEDLAKGMDKMVADEQPDLVVWQTGTIDAIRRVDPDTFKAALEEGVERLHKGGADVITLDTVYDSVLLGTNDYTALFSEEGWLAAKLCHDSRVITVPICSNGLTAAGVEVDCDGANASA